MVVRYSVKEVYRWSSTVVERCLLVFRYSGREVYWWLGIVVERSIGGQIQC